MDQSENSEYQAVFTLVFEHDDFLVIDKLPGVSFHREGENPGIIESVTATLGIDRLWPVHRLDSMTSGLLIMARSEESCRGLSRLFEQRKVEKFYLALSDRKPAKKQGTVEGDMERTRRGSWKLRRTKLKPACTRFFSAPVGAGLRLFLLKPVTGRTHQLRVAMKSLAAPILGDKRYGGGTELSNKLNGNAVNAPGADSAGEVERGYLHAYGVRFAWKGALVTIIQPPRVGRWFRAAKIKVLLDGDWSKPWDLPWPGGNSKVSHAP